MTWSVRQREIKNRVKFKTRHMPTSLLYLLEMSKNIGFMLCSHSKEGKKKIHIVYLVQIKQLL